MKVAIIGAGPAGLSCAYELQRLDVIPDIFESRSCIGSPLEHTICTIRIFDNTYSNILKYLNKKYGIKLNPLFKLTELEMISSNSQSVIRGKKLGYAFKRGNEIFSIENQIARLLSVPVYLNTFINVQDIQNKYDYIVVATGNDIIAKSLNIWRSLFNAQVRVATILGNFKLGSIRMWINTDYSKNCYCYLLPNNEYEACLVLAIDNASSSEMNIHWKEFLIHAGLNYTITETRDVEYSIGYSDTVQIDNILFTGNAAGFSDDFLGFGIVRAIESGIFAARAITGRKQYPKMVKPFIEDITKMHEFRKALDTLDNKDFDRLVTLLGLPGIKHIIYNNPLFRIRQGTLLARLYNNQKYK